MKSVLCRRLNRGQEPVFLDVIAPPPDPPTGRDLLVRVEAVGLNPLDVKRKAARPDIDKAGAVLGWDAAGVVEEVGPRARLFRRGDAVMYAGAILRSGCQSELHLVDERVVAPRPPSFSFAEAAALPMAGLTASESLFDHLRLSDGRTGALLVVGGAGGVASMAIQLARLTTSMTVVAAASRAESQAWVRKMGAHHVVDHTKPLASQLAALGQSTVGAILSMKTGEAIWRQYAQLIASFGHICVVDHPPALDYALMKAKSVGVHWQSMFTRSTYETPDVGRQGDYLRAISSLAEAGALKPMSTQVLRPICAETIAAAHDLLASGRMIGKVVIERFHA